jgi:tryptophan synthase alpha chain
VTRKLEQDLRTRLADKPILLMTHLVVGYPSLEVNREVIRQMAAHGVDCIELQIPFSEPIADGPVILKASQESLLHGISVEDCFRFGQEMAMEFPAIRFLFMTYYNIVFKYGEQAFLRRTQDIGFHGTIIPDLPPEEGQTYLETSKNWDWHQCSFSLPLPVTSACERWRVRGQDLSIVSPVGGLPVGRPLLTAVSTRIWTVAAVPRICPWRWGLASAVARMWPCSLERPTWR